jgi:hypothetical protein
LLQDKLVDVKDAVGAGKVGLETENPGVDGELTKTDETGAETPVLGSET